MLYQLSYAPGTEKRDLTTGDQRVAMICCGSRKQVHRAGLRIFKPSQHRRQPADARQRQRTEAQERQNDSHKVYIRVPLFAA